jgi:hypothetical protein
MGRGVLLKSDFLDSSQSNSLASQVDRLHKILAGFRRLSVLNRLTLTL